MFQGQAAGGTEAASAAQLAALLQGAARPVAQLADATAAVRPRLQAIAVQQHALSPTDAAAQQWLAAADAPLPGEHVGWLSKLLQLV